MRGDKYDFVVNSWWSYLLRYCCILSFIRLNL